MTDTIVTTEIGGQVGIIRFDDGKANALNMASIGALLAAIDEVEAETTALVLLGRPGRFSAGFDLKVMGSEWPNVAELLRAGVDLMLRLYEYPHPVVIGCTGHALAMGALVVLTGDDRVGTEGDFSIGLNEVAIGMNLPVFGVEMARDRLSKRHFTAATQLARIYNPDDAVGAGYLDDVVDADQLEAEVIARAHAYSSLSVGAFAITRASARSAVAASIRATLDEDIETMGRLRDGTAN